MKKEELYRIDYHSAKELQAVVDRYIHFYNIERPHATLHYKTPEAYEKAFFEKPRDAK